MKRRSQHAYIYYTFFHTSLKSFGIEGVSNFTASKGINIFNYKYVVVPVNWPEENGKPDHWTLMILRNDLHTLQVYNSHSSTGGDATGIFLDFLKHEYGILNDPIKYVEPKVKVMEVRNQNIS